MGTNGFLCKKFYMSAVIFNLNVCLKPKHCKERPSSVKDALADI